MPAVGQPGVWNMTRLRWTGRSSLQRLRNSVRCQLNLIKFTCLSLCYNVFVDRYYVADTAMEPMFWFVDHFTKFFGPIFVFAVCSLTLSAVVIVYVVGVPFWWHKSPTALAFLLVLGHWLLVNVVFHYYMAAITQPGLIPEGVLIPEAVSICRKCIAPKPPRTHHCSICNRCILKMDHHCPWLNNCIGHYNHRYFFLYMVYMVAGILFIMMFGCEIAYLDLIGDGSAEAPVVVPSQNVSQIRRSSVINASNEEAGSILQSAVHTLLDRSDDRPLTLRMREQYWYHVCVLYMTLLLVGVFIALGALMTWHARLISRGETSIEAHINKAETKRLKRDGKVHLNPYDFGPYRNWKMFLGVEYGRTWWRHVLLPSSHKPVGDALQWRTSC